MERSEYRQKGKQIVRNVGDKYHEHVFTKIAPVLGKATDAVGPAISDLQLFSTAYKESLLIKQLAKKRRKDHPPRTRDKIKAVAGIAQTVSTGLYLINNARTPTAEKLGLEEKEYDHEAEVNFVIQKINERQDSQSLSFEEIVPLAYHAVTDFLEEVDGYRTESSKKIKKSIWGRTIRRRLGAAGLTTIQMGGEIVAFSDKIPEVPAHEFAHGKGVHSETQAQIISVIAQIESGNPSLEYIGYQQWLRILMQSNGEKDPIPFLEERNLNPRTLKELTDQRSFFQKESQTRTGVSRGVATVGKVVYDMLPQHTQEKATKINHYLDKVLPTAINTLRKNPEQTIEQAIHTIMLKAQGQGDAKTAYARKPAALLANYREGNSEHS